jgi:hypothetical protein
MEFQMDCDSMREAMDYMASETFTANWVGVEFDAGALLARMESGEGDATLIVMPQGPPATIPAGHGLN